MFQVGIHPLHSFGSSCFSL